MYIKIEEKRLKKILNWIAVKTHIILHIVTRFIYAFQLCCWKFVNILIF